MLVGLGLLGFMMRRYNVPVAPVLIAVVLGPLAETELRRALAVSEGDTSILINSPITITIYLGLSLLLAVSIAQHIRERYGKKRSAAGSDRHRSSVGTEADAV